MRKRIFTLLMALFSVIAIEAQVRYVTENGKGDGTSWENASGDIQAMINELDEAGEGGVIRVAQGKYIPTQKIAETDIDDVATTERDKAFLLKSNISLYGGYAGTGNSPDHRDFELYTSILDGAINETDTAYHVVVGVNANDIILDGFTITNGRCFTSYESPDITGGIEIEGETFLRGEAGGLFAKGCTLQLNNLIFKENVGVGAPAFVIVSSDITINESLIESNYALQKTAGGGLLHLSNSVLKKVTFRNNKADGGGNGCPGALYSAAGTLRIEDSAFEYNTSAREGGLLITTPNSEFERVYIRHNQGGITGSNLGAGGISAHSANLKDVWITDNIGYAGGGLKLTAGPNNLENVTMERNVSKIDLGNEKTGYGGALHYSWTGSNGASIEMKNCKISNNTSERFGGAIYASLGYNFNFNLSNSEIKDNQAVKNGGAFYLEQSTINLFNMNVMSSLISGNKVTGTDISSPAVFYVDNIIQTKLNFINSTIVDNKVTGSSYAIMDHANVTIQNTVLWNNLNGSNIESNMDAAVASTIQHSLIGGMDLSASNNNLNGALSAGYYFVDATAGDYSLLPWYTNPAVNSGDDSFITSTITKDAAGNARFVNTVDIGAYEAQNVIDPFTGGSLNDANEREFIYTGTTVALSLQSSIGGTAAFSYQGLNEWNAESGAGLPVNGGLYTVTATISGGTYSGSITSTIVRINKAELEIDFPEIPGMRVGDAQKGSHTLTATNAESLEVAFNIVEGTSVSLTSGVLTAVSEGNSVISADLKNADRNYICSTPPTRTVFVQSEASNDATLAMVTVNGKEAVWSTDKYTVSVPYSTDIVINSTATSSLSTVVDNSAGKNLAKGEITTITLTVTAENTSTQDYTLEVYTQKDITTLDRVTVDGKEASFADNAYTVTIPYTLEATAVYTTTDPNANVSGGTTLKNLILGNNLRSFTVIAEDGTQAIYPLTVKVLNNNANIKTITVKTAESEDVSEVSANSNGDYTITVDYTTAITLTATALDANAVITGQTGTQSVVKGVNTFTVTITSQDGTDTKNYTIEVTVPLNSDTSLKEVIVGGTAAVLNNGRYEAEIVSAAPTSITIAATATDTGFATVAGIGNKEVTMGENIFILSVTAEDGTIGYHTLVVTVKESSGSVPSKPEVPSTPDPNPDSPTVSLQASLPEGVTITPGLGSHKVSLGGSLTLNIHLGDQYDDMRVYLVINGDTIELSPVLRATSYSHTINDIRKDMTIRVLIYDKNGDLVLSNAEIGSDSRIWAAAGMVCVETVKPAQVFIYTFNGQLVAQHNIPAGESRIQLPDGFYIVVLSDGTTAKIAVRNF